MASFCISLVEVYSRSIGSSGIYKDKSSKSAAKRFVAARRKYYIDRIRQEAKSKGLKPLERATARFATVYAAGCLAKKYGIFTWGRKELLRAILSCQLDRLVAARGKTDQVTNLRQRLTDYLIQNRRHFVSLNGKKLSTNDHELGSVPGYRHRMPCLGGLFQGSLGCEDFLRWHRFATQTFCRAAAFSTSAWRYRTMLRDGFSARRRAYAGVLPCYFSFKRRASCHPFTG